MRVLGITSGIGITGAGIAEDGGIGILAETSVASTSVKSERLIELIDDVIKRCKLKIKDVDAVAVTTGPGSYSGLRGGLATAKGLIEGLKIPLLTVSTLRAIAYNLKDADGVAAIAINACRDEYNFAMFVSNGGVQKRLTSDMTVSLDGIVNNLSKVKGSIILACDDRVMESIKNKNVTIADRKNAIPWGVNVARIGIDKLMKKQTHDHILARPGYSHKPNIREFKG